MAVTREKEKADHENKKLVSSDNLFEMSGHCYSSFKRESSLRKLDITDFLVECDNRSWKRYGKGQALKPQTSLIVNFLFSVVLESSLIPFYLP